MNNLYLRDEQKVYITKNQLPDKRFCRAWWEFKKALYPKLGTSALRVFLVLEDRASRWNNYTVPMSLNTLGEETGVRHHTTLTGGIRELEAAGIIEVTRQPGNARTANSYRLLIAELLEDRARDTPPSSQRGEVTPCETMESCCPLVAVAAAPASMGAQESDEGKGQATSAQTELQELPSCRSTSAKNDSVLTCFKTNRTHGFNPDGLNGVTAVKNRPVKANRLAQQQGQQYHPDKPPPEHTSTLLTRPVGAISRVTSRSQPLPEPEDFLKRLSWATSAPERMAVLFGALRWALGSEPAKAEFSGVQALVNEYGCRAVLAGILTTTGREVARPAYFAYLRGVIRQQQPAWEQGQAGNSHRRQAGSVYLATTAPKRPPNLPVDLAKYTGNGKYAHLIASNHTH